MLVAANITMQFGAKPLFENVSVKFGDGLRYGLIGANGAGKSTFMKILTQKGFLEPQKREGGGKTLFFAPLITQDEYRDRVMSEVKDNFFGGSVKSLVSYFMKEEKLSSQEIDELMELIKKEAVGM